MKNVRSLYCLCLLGINLFGTSISVQAQSKDTTLYQSVQEIKIYPNPASEVVYIQTNKYPTFAGIANNRGVIIGYIDIKKEVQGIDITSFKPGTYFLIINDTSHRILIE